MIDYLSKPIALKEEQKQKTVQEMLAEAAAATKFVDTLLPKKSGDAAENKNLLDNFIQFKDENSDAEYLQKERKDTEQP